MNALYLVVAALAIGAIAYRYYSAFIAAKVMVLNDARTTPAHAKYDGSNYYPTQKWVLFGHHFAAIAGAGPLIGPVLATQFGWAPSFMWMLAGCVLGGAVHDMVSLWVSTRRGGRSLAEIARSEIGPVAGVTAIIAVLFILVVALAGLGLIVVNALAESAWGMFTIGVTIPIAVFMGFYMFKWRKGQVKEATAIGVTLMLLGVVFGKNFAESSVGHVLVLSAAPDHGGDGHLRLRRRRHPGVDAADPALVPQHLHEDRHHPAARGRRHRRCTRAWRRRRSRSTSAAAVRSFPGRSSHSCSSPSRAAPSPASTRSSAPAPRRRWWTRRATSARSATWACCSRAWLP